MRVSWTTWAALTLAVAALAALPPVGPALAGLPGAAATTVLGTTNGSRSAGGFVVENLYSGHLPEFPTNLTHFVYIVRENHVFDDYLGDCATTVNASCNNGTDYYLSPNHINDTPYLHDLARNYSVFDNYYSSTDPYSAEAHAYYFAANATSSDSCASAGVEGTGPGTEWAIYNATNVRHGNCAYGLDSGSQTYPARGTVFDRFVKRSTSFLVVDDFVWELNNPGCTLSGISAIPGTLPGNSGAVENVSCGSTNGWWLNPSTDHPTMPPVVNPVTHVPQLLDVCEYTCGVYGSGTSSNAFLDQYAANNFVSYVKDYGLPTYTFIELFDDHPGPQCGAGQTYDTCIKWNDAATNEIVNAVMQPASAYRNSTVLAIQDDDTQNGQNGPDHVNDGRRLPLVVVAPHPLEFSGGTSCGTTGEPSCGVVVHGTTNTSNILAVMERVEMNVDPGIFETAGYGGISTFPMEENDYLAEGSPLEPLWNCASPRVVCNTGLAVTVGAAAVAPGTATVPGGGAVVLNASALDANGYPVAGASYAWNVTNASTTGLTLNTSAGPSVKATAGPDAGTVTVCATASMNGTARLACARVTVSAAVAVLARASAPPDLTVATGGSGTVGVRLWDQFGRPFASSAVTYRWSVTPSYLGAASPSTASGTANTTTFTAATYPGAGTLTVTVQNGSGRSLSASTNLTVTSGSSGTTPPTPTAPNSGSGGIPTIDWVVGAVVAAALVTVAGVVVWRRRSR